MAILAGNITFRALIHFRYEFQLFPWVRKNGAIICLKRTACNSSGPVRYIPKKFQKDEKFDNSSSRIDSGRNTSRDRSSPNRRAEVTDEDLVQGSILPSGKSQKEDQSMKICFSSGESDQEFEDDFDHDFGSVGNDIMEHPDEIVEDLKFSEKIALQGRSNKQDAEQFATKSLAARALTVVELKKKLQGKKFSIDATEAVLNEFKTSGLINDNLYAESFSRSRWTSYTWGPRRIKQALLKKGINEVDAEKAVKLVFEDSEDGDRESRSGLSKTSMDHLFVQASKQWLKGRDVPLETRKGRIIRWLQYRGFNWDVISSLLKKLELENPISHSM